MSCDIGPGDWVECINTTHPELCPVGSVWLVEDTVIGAGAYRDLPCLILKGLVSPLGFRRVYAGYFRPILRPSADLIQSLKAPAPKEPVQA